MVAIIILYTDKVLFLKNQIKESVYKISYYNYNYENNIINRLL